MSTQNTLPSTPDIELSSRSFEALGPWVSEIQDIAIYELSPDGTILAWNRGAAHLFGFRPAQILDSSFACLFPEKTRSTDAPRRTLAEALANGTTCSERHGLRADGSIVVVIETITPLFDSRQHHTGFAVVTRDITHERTLERRLDVAERRFRTLFERAPVGVVLADGQSYYTDANACVCEMLGYTRDELVGLHASDIVVQSEVPQIDVALNEIHGEIDHAREWEFRRKDGSVLTADVVATLMPDGTLVGTFRDLSDRRGAETSREHLAAIVDSSQDAIIGTDLDSTIVSWNAGAEAIFGYRAADIVGKTLFTLFPEDRCDEETRSLERLRQGDRVEILDTTRLANDGRLIDVSVAASPIRDTRGRIVGTSRIIRDIYPLKLREREIARLSRLYAALSHINQAIVVAGSPQDLFSRVCRVLVELGGFRTAWIGWHEHGTPEDAPFCGWGEGNDELCASAVSPDGVLVSDPTWTALLSGRPCVYNDLLRAPEANLRMSLLESLGVLSAAAFPIRRQNIVVATLNVYAENVEMFHDREVSLLQEAAVDLSFALDNYAREDARQAAEQTLRSEMHFSDNMIESMPGVVYVYDLDGTFLRWNKNFEQVSGYEGVELKHMHPLDFFVGDERGRVEERIAEVFAIGESAVEAQFTSKNGQSTPYYFTGRSVTFEGKPCLVGVGIDISARREAENKLAESEQKYRELVQYANSIILRWNAEGKITFLNEFGQKFFGYAEDEIIGRHVLGTIVPTTETSGRDLGQLMDEICAAPEAYEQNINENVRSNGERVWIAWTNRIIRDERGHLIEIMSVGTDVTARRRAEAARLEAELRFHTLFEQTPVGVVVADAVTGSIIEANRQAARQLGYARQELCALTIHDIDAHGPRHDAEHLIRYGNDQYETQHRTKGGTIRDVLVSAQLLELNGHPFAHSVFLDITERKHAEAKLRESEAHLLEAQRIAKIGSWEVDLGNEQVKWSDQIFDIFGLSRAERIDAPQNHLEYVHPEDLDRLRLARAAAFRGETVLDLQYRIVLEDGSEKIVHELARLRRDLHGVPVALSGTLHDVTDRERVAAEEEKRHRAEAADRIKSAFLATMSHELRTPLNSIIGFTGIMLQGLAGPINDEQNKQLDMVRRSARHLLALVNDVLDISKIEAGQVEVAQAAFNASASIEKVIALVRSHAEAKHLGLMVRVEPTLGTIVSDERRFEQILLNLMNNAIKFTDTGRVGLDAGTVTDDPSVLEIRVSDTGIGIRPEDLPTLFQPFRQIDSGLSRKHEGTGLGLAICRRLATLLGGDIHVESTWGEGCTFTLTLPRHRQVTS